MFDLLQPLYIIAQCNSCCNNSKSIKIETKLNKIFIKVWENLDTTSTKVYMRKFFSNIRTKKSIFFQETDTLNFIKWKLEIQILLFPHEAANASRKSCSNFNYFYFISFWYWNIVYWMGHWLGQSVKVEVMWSHHVRLCGHMS